LDGGVNPYVYAQANPTNYLDPQSLTTICSYMFSIPGDLDWKTETKWDPPGRWFLENTYTQGGQGPAFWLTAECICARYKSGTRTTTITMKWVNFFLCYDDITYDTWIKKTFSYDDWKRTNTVLDVERKILAGGLYLNETSAELGCARKCQNLNLQ